LLFFFKKRLTNRTLFAAIPMNDRNRTRHSANCFSDFYSCKKQELQVYNDQRCIQRWRNGGEQSPLLWHFKNVFSYFTTGI